MHDTVFIYLVLNLIERHTHLDAQTLHLVAARHDTTVIARQHNHGFVAQVGTEHPFATHEKVITIR